jgi:hypothetical protein
MNADKRRSENQNHRQPYRILLYSDRIRVRPRKSAANEFAGARSQPSLRDDGFVRVLEDALRLDQCGA